MNENEQYLRGLHKHLKIEESYEGWYRNVSGNEDYLRGLHGHLGVKDDYNTWYTSVWGTDVKKKTRPKFPLLWSQLRSRVLWRLPQVRLLKHRVEVRLLFPRGRE